jgi:D-lyxose ketol-isomerase
VQHWTTLGSQAQEIIEAGLGWDVTDFGLGKFHKSGAVLFTLRNGNQKALSQGQGKVYCEKIIVLNANQTILHHYHQSKTEDIINRAGGQLELILHMATPEGKFSNQDVHFSGDGIKRQVKAGGKVILEVGESITLEPFVYHQFRALNETILIGEVSTVNDDANDNFFFHPVGRFSKIEVDTQAYRLLVNEYPKKF